MKDYVARMVKEHDELTGRIKKAQYFVDRNANTMHPVDKELLVRQIQLMWEYASVLELRLSREDVEIKEK